LPHSSRRREIRWPGPDRRPYKRLTLRRRPGGAPVPKPSQEDRTLPLGTVLSREASDDPVTRPIHSAVRDSHKMLRAIGRRLPRCLTHGRAWRRQRKQNAAKADVHGGIRRSNSRRTWRRTGRPVRQPGLVISLGFGGLPPWADGSTPNTAVRRARIAASHRTGCRARSWRALVTDLLTCSIAGTSRRG
jgi:hypothetical protein